MLNQKAFTIIELVIVISVLIILIGITIPSMRGMQQSGMIVKIKKELQTFQAAVESYYTNSSPNAYPMTPGSGSAVMGANYLVTASPQIITSPLLDPYDPGYEYWYFLSANGQYYVIASQGPNGKWGCFTPGTKVSLADGKTKNIELLKVGDVLIGPQNEHNKVVYLRIMPQQDRKIYAFNNGRYFVTDDHIFMTKNGWKAINPKAAQQKYFPIKVGKLQVNDELITLNGIIKLKKIDFIIRDSVVYDPQLDGSHTYYADGFLVHNVTALANPTITSAGVVAFTNGKGDDICVTNGTGC